MSTHSCENRYGEWAHTCDSSNKTVFSRPVTERESSGSMWSGDVCGECSVCVCAMLGVLCVRAMLGVLCVRAMLGVLCLQC